MPVNSHDADAVWDAMRLSAASSGYHASKQANVPRISPYVDEQLEADWYHGYDTSQPIPGAMLGPDVRHLLHEATTSERDVLSYINPVARQTYTPRHSVWCRCGVKCSGVIVYDGKWTHVGRVSYELLQIKPSTKDSEAQGTSAVSP